MERLRAFVASATLVVAMFAGTPSTLGAVDSIYVGGNASVAGGSCADPDFSTAGGYDAAMASALAAIDADGDTVVLCGGSYSIISTDPIEVEHTFTVRAETRRGVTIGGNDVFLEICAPKVTVRGLRFVDLDTWSTIVATCESVSVDVIDVEIFDSGGLAWSLEGGGELISDGTLRIVNSHIHDNTMEAIVVWGSVAIENTLFERNFSLFGFFAPVTLSIESSSLESNLSVLALGATGCLSVVGSSVEGNGVGALEDFDFIPAHTLVSLGFEDDWSCPARVLNSKFKGNIALAGGGLTLVDPDPATLVKGNTFTGNTGLLAGAVVVCSEVSSRRLESLAKRIGFFKANRYRGNSATDRRSNNSAYVVDDCGFDLG